jgi:hypothetical protein
MFVNVAIAFLFVWSQCVISLPYPAQPGTNARIAKRAGDLIIEIPIPLFNEIRDLMADVRRLGYSSTAFFLDSPLDFKSLAEGGMITGDLSTYYENSKRIPANYKVNWKNFAGDTFKEVLPENVLLGEPRQFQQQLQQQVYKYVDWSLNEVTMNLEGTDPLKVQAAYNLAQNLKIRLSEKIMGTTLSGEEAIKLFWDSMPKPEPGGPEIFRRYEDLRGRQGNFKFYGKINQIGGGPIFVDANWIKIMEEFCWDRQVLLNDDSLNTFSRTEYAAFQTWEKTADHAIASRQGARQDYYLDQEDIKRYIITHDQQRINPLAYRVWELTVAGAYPPTQPTPLGSGQLGGPLGSGQLGESSGSGQLGRPPALSPLVVPPSAGGPDLWGPDGAYYGEDLTPIESQGGALPRPPTAPVGNPNLPGGLSPGGFGTGGLSPVGQPWPGQFGGSLPDGTPLSPVSPTDHQIPGSPAISDTGADTLPRPGGPPQGGLPASPLGGPPQGSLQPPTQPGSSMQPPPIPQSRARKWLKKTKSQMFGRKDPKPPNC